MSHSNLSHDADAKLLNSIRIASPRHVDWETMTGDERKRFCGDCKLNVYNISEMTKKDAANLIRQSEGRACLRLYMRQDGTIITDNCPVGLRKVRERILKVAAIVTAQLAIAGILSSHAQGCEPIERSHGLVPPPPIMPQHITMGVPATVHIPQRNLVSEFSGLLNAAGILSSVGLILLALLKKTRPTTIGLMLLAIWGFTGFVIGILIAFKG
jgi:hypothetical protein